jgi:hypothetical protein
MTIGHVRKAFEMFTVPRILQHQKMKNQMKIHNQFEQIQCFVTLKFELKLRQLWFYHQLQKYEESLKNLCIEKDRDNEKVQKSVYSNFFITTVNEVDTVNPINSNSPTASVESGENEEKKENK